MTPALTHYERVMTCILPYDAQCRSFAQRAVSSEKPYEALEQFLSKRSAPMNSVRSQEDLVRLFLPLHEEMIGNVHHLVQEMLRKQKSKYSLWELTGNSDFARILAPLCVRQNLAQLHTVGHMQYHVATHRMTGKKTYDVQPGLAERLKNTELRGLTADDLHLPFPSIYLVVPPEAELQIYNTESDWHKVVGIYITEDVDAKGYRCWRFLVCGEPKPREVMGVKDDNDALIFFHVPLPTGSPLTDAVAKAQEECDEDVKRDSKWVKNAANFMKNDWPHIFRWAMNVVLYISTENAESEEVIANEEARRIVEQMKGLPNGSGKKNKLGGRLSKMQQCQRIILGKSVAIQKGGWSLTVRVLVSGHWRNQPFGPGRMYRRIQWIEPFWRGPDGTEMATATTEVAPATSEPGGTDDTRNRKSDHGPGEVDTKTQPDDRVPCGVSEGDGSPEATDTRTQGPCSRGAGSDNEPVDRAGISSPLQSDQRPQG